MYCFSAYIQIYDNMESPIGTSLDSGNVVFKDAVTLVKQRKLNYKAMTEMLFVKYPGIATEIFHATLDEKETKVVKNPMSTEQKLRIALSRQAKKEHMDKFKESGGHDQEAIQAEIKRYDAEKRKNKRLLCDTLQKRKADSSSNSEDDGDNGEDAHEEDADE